MTSNEGAILILPDGASRWELDEAQVQELETYVKKYALQMCRFAKKDTLYLVTAVVKSKSWTLGSFYNGSHGSEILVRRSSSNGNGTFTYQWVSETNVDNQQGPQNNHYLNQTVLLKGFKIMRRGGWLPSIALWARERGVKFEVGPGFESRPGLVETCIDLLPEQWVTPASKSCPDVTIMKRLSTRIMYRRRAESVPEQHSVCEFASGLHRFPYNRTCEDKLSSSRSISLRT